MIYYMTYVVEKSPWDIGAADKGTGEIIQRQDLTDKTDFFYWLFFKKAEASKFKKMKKKSLLVQKIHSSAFRDNHYAAPVINFSLKIKILDLNVIYLS